MNKAIFYFFQKTYSKQIKALSLVLLLIIIIFIIICFFTKIDSGYLWPNIFDPALTIFSIIFPIALALLVIDIEWKESLEKKLVVHFSFKSEDSKVYVMSCYNINLLSSADMRAIGQQIGGQMSTVGNQLKFNPSIKPLTEEIKKVKDRDGGIKWIKYFEIEFLLSEEPEGVSPKKDLEKPQYPLINKYLVWNLFDEDKLTKTFSQRPSMPIDKNPQHDICIEDLLSFDEDSKYKFEKVS